MSVHRPSGYPSNMGQEQSALAQQSINISARDSLMTSAHGTQSPQAINNSTIARGPRSERYDRSRSPDDRNTTNLPPPQRQHARWPDARARQHSPPLRVDHSTGRFPSPGSVRHRFVREQPSEERSTAFRGATQGSSPRLQNARLDSRDDTFSQSSTISRRYSDNLANWARNSGSSHTPNVHAARRPIEHTPDGSRGAQGTINFDGLRDVPTGPRRSLDERNTHTRDSFTQSPCIFIPFQKIRKLPHLTHHLRRMLGRGRVTPTQIVADEYGWDLIFEDSLAGRETLRRCYEKFHKGLLFDQYELFMECFPGGKQPHAQHHQSLHNHFGPNVSNEIALSSSRPELIASTSSSRPADHRFTNAAPSQTQATDPVSSPHSKEMNSPTHTLPNHASLQNTTRDLSEWPRTQDHTPAAIDTSLLSLRSDRDETGSLASGVTRSDSSRVKRNRCHICGGETVHGLSTLVCCSTCPREYHRRCHPNPAIPADLPADHDWICRRCVKKGKASTVRPSGDSVRPLSGPAPTQVETESLSRPSHNEPQTEPPKGHAPLMEKATDAAITAAEISRSDYKSPQNEGDQHADATGSPKSSTVQRDLVLSDADDLVVKSFAAAENQSQLKPPSIKLGKMDVTSHLNPNAVEDDPVLSDADDLVAKSFAAIGNQSLLKPQSVKTGKLKVTRTKLTQKAKGAAEQSQSEKTFVQDTTVGNDPAPARDMDASTNSVNENMAVVKNTAADLRALAIERHQTAIKIGTQGYPVSEEQGDSQSDPSFPVAPSSAHRYVNEQSRLSQHATNTTSGSSVPTAFAQTAEREIPESPDEVRRDGPHNGATTSDPRLLVKLGGSARRYSLDHTPVAKSTRPRRASGPGPRLASAVSECSMCQRKIPQAPSSRSGLCSGCKKAKAAADADAKRVSSTTVTPVRTTIAPVAKMVADQEMVDVPATEPTHAFESTMSRHEQNDVHTPDDSTAQVSKTSVHQPGKAVATKSSTSELTNTSALALRQDMTPQQNEEHHIVNHVAAKILGELQFSPTVQRFLRADVPMSEFKIRQLKRILIEDETTRTDDEVLAAKLEDALTSLRDVPPTQIPGSTDSTDLDNNATTAVPSPDVPSSQSKLNFIRSVVGDSFERPKGSRLILVAMALGSSPARRLQAKDIMDWIATTIPTYTKGEGTWESRISAQLSQGRVTKPGTGYWREEPWQPGDGGKAKSKWYQLLSEKEDEMWMWCPVLKEPLSPQSRRDTAGQEADENHAVAPVHQTATPQQASASATRSDPTIPDASKKDSVSIYCGSFVMGDDERQDTAPNAEAEADDAMELDDEQQNTVPNAGADANDAMELDDAPYSVVGKKRKHKSSLELTDPHTPTEVTVCSDDEGPLSARTKRRRREASSRARTDPMSPPQRLCDQEAKDRLELPANAKTTSEHTTRKDSTNEDTGSVSKKPRVEVGEERPGVVIFRLDGLKTLFTTGSADLDKHKEVEFPANEETTIKHATRQNTANEIAGNASMKPRVEVSEKRPGVVIFRLDGLKTLFTTGSADLNKPGDMVTSFYDEWPEYRQHAADEHNKLAEIRSRPRKKAMFGKRTAPMNRRPQEVLFNSSKLIHRSPEKRLRTTIDPMPDDPYPWENPETDPMLKECKSLEEFFDFPDSIMPIVSDGQLAYRDGTRTDDGRLPRARQIFKP